MARVSSIFNMSGKLTNVIFSSRYGKPYVRMAPFTVKNPNTEKQQAVRNRFRAAVAFYNQLKDTPLRDMWRSAARQEQRSGFALFMRKNLTMFDFQGGIADFDGLRLSTGPRSGVLGLTASVEDEWVTLRWMQDDENRRLNGGDRLWVVLMYGERIFSPKIVDGLRVTRGDGRAGFALQRQPDEQVHVYCFFEEPFTGVVSESQHVLIEAGG